MKTQPRPNINKSTWKVYKPVLLIGLTIVIVLGIITIVLIRPDFNPFYIDEPPITSAVVPIEKPPTHIQPDSIIKFILEQEGGYNPADPSYEGVYQPTWDWYRKVVKDPSYPVDVKMLVGKNDLIIKFYNWYLYELHSGVNDVPDWFKLMLADFWTTSMSESIRPLQEWAGIEIDGVWGVHTKSAVMAKFQYIKDRIAFARWYTKYRKDHYRERGHHESSGLMTRADIVLAETIKRIYGNIQPVMHRTINETDMRIHAPEETLTIEERLDKLESLILQLADD